MQVIWKPLAVEAIEEYYLKVAPEFAEIIINEILDRVKKLETSPQSGRKVPEINDSVIREIIYRNYRIIYHVLPGSDRIEILTVFHSAKEFG